MGQIVDLHVYCWSRNRASWGNYPSISNVKRGPEVRAEIILIKLEAVHTETFHMNSSNSSRRSTASW